MIEELASRIAIHSHVYVKELQVRGYIYERGQAEHSTVYGVRLDETAFPKNFVATTVWHCEREGLELL